MPQLSLIKIWFLLVLGVHKLGFCAVVCVPQLGGHVGNMLVVVHNVGGVNPAVLGRDLTASVPKPGATRRPRLRLVRILLDFRHWINFPVVKRLEVTPAGLMVGEMEITL